MQWDNITWITWVFSGIGIPAVGIIYKIITKKKRSSESNKDKKANLVLRDEGNKVNFQKDISGDIIINNFYGENKNNLATCIEEVSIDCDDEANDNKYSTLKESVEENEAKIKIYESAVCETDNLLMEVENYLKENVKELPRLKYYLNSIELKRYKEDLIRMKSIIEQEKFRIVFVGPTGVGKTTTICYLFDLLIEENGNYTELFKVQGGNCTPCNTIIKNSDKTKIIVKPLPKNELERLLKKYCSESLNEGISSEEHTHILSEEAKGILDTILYEKNIDIEEVAKSFNINGQELYNMFEKLIGLEKYTEDEIILEFQRENSTNLQELKWIQKEVIRYTSGKGDNCIIPETITIEINRKVKVLPDFVDEIVDTRGLYEIEFNETEVEETNKDKNPEHRLAGFSKILNRDDLKRYIEDSNTMMFFVTKPQEPQKYLKEYFNSLVCNKYVEDILRNHIIINLDKDAIALEVNNKNKVTKKKIEEIDLIEKKQKSFKNKILNLQKQFIDKIEKDSKQSWIIENWEKNISVIDKNSIEYINCIAIDSLKYLKRNTSSCTLEFIDLKKKENIKKEMQDYRNRILKKIQDSFETRKKISYIEFKQLRQQINKLLNTDFIVGPSEYAYKDFLNNMRVFSELYSNHLCEDIIAAIEESSDRHGNHWKSVVAYILWYQGYKDIYADEISWYVRNEINHNLKNYIDTSNRYISEFTDKLSNISMEEKNEIMMQVSNVIKIVCDEFYEDFIKKLTLASSTLYGDANIDCIAYWSAIRDKYEILNKKPSIKAIVKKELQIQRLQHNLSFNKNSKYDDFIRAEVKNIFNHEVMEKLENAL